MIIGGVFGLKSASVLFTADAGIGPLATNTTLFTFTATSIGTATADRVVIVSVYYADTTSLSCTLTVGGITATEIAGCHIRSSSGGSTESHLRMFYAAVPSGATADIVAVVGSTGCKIFEIGVWAAYDLLSAAPTASRTTTPASSVFTFDINVEPQGIAVAYGAVPNPVTWAGATEDFDDFPAGPRHSGAHLATDTGGTPVAISATTTGAGGVGCAASFR